MPQEQVERLDALGMDWTNRNDRKWMSLYDVAAAYYHEHGNLNVPSEYVTPDGVLLGKWVARQRYAYLNPDRSSARVTPERKALLDKLGMVWEKYDPWQERYDLALAYKTEHGDLEIPSVYKTEDGVWLGSWVSRQRQALNSGSSALSSERRKLLRTLFKGERRPSDPAADHGTVRDHAIYIDSDVVTAVDSGLIPTGGYMPVSQTPLDLREEMLIGDGLDCMNECVPMRYAKGYDCNYVLRKGSAMGLCACVHHEESGRTMEVITDQPGVQFYTACTTDYADGKGGMHYLPYSGLCLETQHYPDSPNHPNFPTTTLRPGEIYDTTTIYAFRVDA